MIRFGLYLVVGLSLVVILTTIVVVNEKLSSGKGELVKLPGNFLAESAGN